VAMMAGTSLTSTFLRPSTNRAAGIVVFHSLAEALRAGFSVYEPTESGYRLRIKTAAGWAFALCVLR
jgi:hypothetical protein